MDFCQLSAWHSHKYLSTFDSQCLKYCICLCFVSDGRFLFFSFSSISTNSWWTLSCRHVYFPWFTASCHHDRICNIWSLSFHTPYSLGLHFFPIVASLQRIGLCHILTSVRMIFYTCLDFSIKFCLDLLPLWQVQRHSGTVFQVPFCLFSFDLPMCAYFSQKHRVSLQFPAKYPSFKSEVCTTNFIQIWLSQYNTNSTFDPWPHWLNKGQPQHKGYPLACFKSSSKMFSRYWSNQHFMIIFSLRCAKQPLFNIFNNI